MCVYVCVCRVNLLMLISPSENFHLRCLGRLSSDRVESGRVVLQGGIKVRGRAGENYPSLAVIKNIYDLYYHDNVNQARSGDSC